MPVILLAFGGTVKRCGGIWNYYRQSHLSHIVRSEWRRLGSADGLEKRRTRSFAHCGIQESIWSAICVLGELAWSEIRIGFAVASQAMGLLADRRRHQENGNRAIRAMVCEPDRNGVTNLSDLRIVI